LQSSVSDGGSGAGEFKINGVSIAFNASADSVSGVLARINNSSAGVIASYDSVNDRFTLTNKTTGDMGIAFEDVTGNFLAATKLSSGSLQRGNNLLYTLDDGAELVSQSNTITEASSGLAGLSVTARKGTQ
jgi:flagellar hook-associated protein 2